MQLEWVASYPGRRVIVQAQTREEASEIANETQGTYPDDVWQSRTVLP